MSDIYEQIWDADLENGNGVKALTPENNADAFVNTGYVIVHEKHTNTNSGQLLPVVHIPEPKRESYRRVAAMLNNYTLDQTKPENNLLEEESEVQNYIDFIIDSAPMQIARNYVE